MSGRVVHFELPFDDGERARSFYSALFDWKLDEMPGLDYTLVTTGPSGERGPTEPGYVNGGMAQRGNPLDRPLFVVDVADIDDTLAQIEGRGGSVVQAKTLVGPMGWNAYFRDTEGNVVGLWQSA
jgi:predicted enzyme related to lactoylglutathione lyase